MKPKITLSLKQENTPKNLMRQLVTLLPLNDMQLNEVIRKEVAQNPFLYFPTSNTIDIDTVGGVLGVQHASIYKILTPQIDSRFKGEDHHMALHFLSLIDDDGFLRQYNNPFGKLGIDIIERLHKLEPSGVFARNLPEFYKNYLESEKKLTPHWAKFISHLNTIATGNMSEAISDFGSQELFDVYLHDLRDLPTRPNLDFSVANSIRADVIASKNGDSYSLNLQSNLHTILHIDNDYVDDVRGHTLKSEDKKFITEKFISAKWLKSALQMRADTLLNISSALVNEQTDFLNGGNLRPLTMQSVADKTGVHISTVSRIANNKYIQTPLGTIPFKKLFSADSADGVSQDTILKMIVKLINGEIHQGIILSDEKIVQILKQNNVTIARRTVAKYREMQDIPPSSIRKQKLRLKRT